MSRALERHEKILGQLSCAKQQIELKRIIVKGKSIDSLNQNLNWTRKKGWVAVLEGIINIIQFLARKCLAFRGTTEKLYESDNGIFFN